MAEVHIEVVGGGHKFRGDLGAKLKSADFWGGAL